MAAPMAHVLSVPLLPLIVLPLLLIVPLLLVMLPLAVLLHLIPLMRLVSFIVGGGLGMVHKLRD